MHYVSKDDREVFIYDFDKKQKTLVLNFSKREGLVSHMKMLFTDQGNFLFYVRNSKDIIQ